jgi:hypothetical protein
VYVSNRWQYFGLSKLTRRMVCSNANFAICQGHGRISEFSSILFLIHLPCERR